MDGKCFRWGISYSALMWALALGAPVPATAAPRETVLYSFTGGPDGAYPLSELLQTKSGALIGTASEGGDLGTCGGKGCGVVFELTPPGPGGGQWKEKVLHQFNGSAYGAAPVAGVLMDKTGALYGTTSEGGGGPCHSYKQYTHISSKNIHNRHYWKKEGQVGCGTIFKLTPPAIGHPLWTETVLHAFAGKDGRSPAGVPLMDKTGALYGVTNQGGEGPCGYMLTTFSGTSNYQYHLQLPTGCGTIFRVTPPAAGRDAWTLTTLHRFQSKPDGAFPDGGVIFAADGSLLGTTHGAYDAIRTTTYTSFGLFSNKPSYHYGAGTVFKLTPPAADRTVWDQTMLYAFSGKKYLNGSAPRGPLYSDRAGALFATAANVAFQLSPPSKGSEPWTEAILYSFRGERDGVGPSAGLIRAGATGAFYGVTAYGGSGGCGLPGCGIVFSLAPPAAGKGKWTEAVLHSFGARNDGQYPQARLTRDKAGNLYGTTDGGGAHLYGTVFKVSR